MGHKKYCIISGALFSLVAIAHVVRIVNGYQVLVDDYAVPMFASWIAAVVPGILAVWAFRLAGR